MDDQSIKTELQFLAKQIPNPYQYNTWYKAVSIIGKEFEIMKKSKNCLYIRRMMKHILKSSDGEIIREKMDYCYFRGNLKSGKLVEL